MMNYYPYQNYGNFQPMQSQPQLVGKMVDDFSTITASDIPMDGNPAVFIKRDLSCVQIRKWGNDGRIYTSAYNPIQTDEIQKANNLPSNNENALNGLNERLNAIEDKLDKLIKPIKKGTADAT